MGPNSMTWGKHSLVSVKKKPPKVSYKMKISAPIIEEHSYKAAVGQQ